LPIFEVRLRIQTGKIMVKKLNKNIEKSLRQQLNELIEKDKVTGKKLDWDKFFGKVKFPEDPVQYQRKLRDEWG
jgi:hypothetical protein